MRCIIKALLCMTVILLYVGCTRGFRPPPPEYKYWNGSSDHNIKVALLECGSPSPYKSMSQTATMNDAALMRRCMINFGFRISGENDLCKLTSNSLAACQPDAIIPTRSVERRLSSAYCKGYGKNTPECLPPGQEYVPQQQPQKNSGGTYEPMREYPERSIQLQQDIQNQSNREMERMLHNTAPNNRR